MQRAERDAKIVGSDLAQVEWTVRRGLHSRLPGRATKRFYKKMPTWLAQKAVLHSVSCESIHAHAVLERGNPSQIRNH
jgi:hypothetical protein